MRVTTADWPPQRSLRICNVTFIGYLLVTSYADENMKNRAVSGQLLNCLVQDCRIFLSGHFVKYNILGCNCLSWVVSV